jgi:hypothetical protein
MVKIGISSGWLFAKGHTKIKEQNRFIQLVDGVELSITRNRRFNTYDSSISSSYTSFHLSPKKSHIPQVIKLNKIHKPSVAVLHSDTYTDEEEQTQSNCYVGRMETLMSVWVLYVSMEHHNNATTGATLTDPRSEAMKISMAEHFDDFEYEYRQDPHTGAEVVYEDDRVIVVSDHTGHELNEWVSDFNMTEEDSDAFRGWNHEVARELTDHNWTAVDPVVFDKLEESE